MSKHRHLQQRSSKLEMTPMIDVTFLLLVFFMCTLQFKTLEGKLAASLPRDVGQRIDRSDPTERIDLRLEVAVPGNRVTPGGQPWPGTGRYTHDATRRLRYVVGARETGNLADVARRIGALRAADPARGITIDAREGILYGEVVAVLDVLIGAGADDVSFVTAP